MAAITGVNNLVKLLPTTTVFAFQALNPYFSNKGKCLAANKYLSATLIIVSSLSCIFFSFTDSFLSRDKKKLYFGLATPKGFIVINSDGKEEERKDLKLRISDYINAVLTVLVFLSFSIGDAYVQECFFKNAGNNTNQLLSNLPLGFGLFAAMVFLIMPKTRKEIGYTDEIIKPVEAAAQKTADSSTIASNINDQELAIHVGN